MLGLVICEKQTSDDLFLTLHSQKRGKSKFEKKKILYNTEMCKLSEEKTLLKRTQLQRRYNG